MAIAARPSSEQTDRHRDDDSWQTEQEQQKKRNFAEGKCPDGRESFNLFIRTMNRHSV